MPPGKRTRHTGGRGGFEPRPVIREREARVVELTNRGRTQREIANELGLTQPGVWKILRRIDDRALLAMHRERLRLIVRNNRRIDHLYRQAQDGWDRSCADRERRRQRLVTARGPNPTEYEVVEVTREQQNGDPRFLREGVHALAEQRTTLQLDTLDWAVITHAREQDALARGETPDEEVP